MITHGFEHSDPTIGHFHAGTHRVEVEQAHAKAGGKAHERHAGQEVKGVKAGIEGHGHEGALSFYKKIIRNFAKFFAGDKLLFCYVFAPYCNISPVNIMLIVLFQPDMAPNVGSMIRLAACMAVALHIIEPCGFPFDDKRMQRAAMDYYALAQIVRHSSWQAFEAWRKEHGGRLVLLTTKTQQSYAAFAFRADDMLLLGQESAGVPDFVRAAVDESITVPVAKAARSLNLVQAASMVVGEALRQTRAFP